MVIISRHLLNSIPLIRSCPRIKVACSHMFYLFNYYRYRISGTSISENRWAKRHLHRVERNYDDWGRGCNDWIEGYWNSRTHPHRMFLIDIISNCDCINKSENSALSILEVGSNCGPNLYLLGRKFPDANIVGVDINSEAIRRGNEWLRLEGISNVILYEGRVDDLRDFKDNSFDIVFTDAMLIYIGPDKIKEVISELLRITSKKLILVELCISLGENDPEGLGIFYNGLWKRDYESLLNPFTLKKPIMIRKIPEDIWPGKPWCYAGVVIQVDLDM